MNRGILKTISECLIEYQWKGNPRQIHFEVIPTCLGVLEKCIGLHRNIITLDAFEMQKRELLEEITGGKLTYYIIVIKGCITVNNVNIKVGNIYQIHDTNIFIDGKGIFLRIIAQHKTK